MTTAPTAPPHRTVYVRMGRNIAWLLGGKGFGAVASLIYLALAARTMGPNLFGIFALILAYEQAIANVVQFQTWHAVIRYGSGLLGVEDRPRLARLLGFTACIDWAGAIVGSAIALGGISLAAPFLGWSAEEGRYAVLLAAVLMFSINATPNGILRLAERFDLITYAAATVPLIRLIGSVIAWGLHAGLAVFLTVWAAAGIVQAVATWVLALRATPYRPRLSADAIRAAWRENGGIGRFLIATNLTASLTQLWDQLGTLAVGGIAGPAAAGGYRIAGRLAKALSKPITLLAKVVFPELSKLAAEGDQTTLRHIVGRVTAVAAFVSVAVVMIAWLGGPGLLHLIGGGGFGFAHSWLVLLTVAAAIELAGFVLEPWLTAQGRAGTVLWGRAIGTIVYGGLLVLLIRSQGPAGAAIAAIAGAVTIRLLLLLVARRLWRSPATA